MRHLRLVPDSANTDHRRTYYDKSWALLVGINDYGTQHPRLVNARNDAAAMARLLQSDYKFDHVITLYDGEATHNALVEWLHDRLPTQIGPNDRLVFFFAGHGTTRKPSHGPIRGYLVPQDAKANQYSSYIDMTELCDACGFIPARHIFFILDCCFSGVVTVTRAATPPPPPQSFNTAYLQGIIRRSAWQILTASAEDEPAADSGRRPGHSAFTGALLSGLEGGADLNADGIITATELANFVKPEVNKETTARGGAGQMPYFRYLAGSGQGDFVFLRPDHPIRIAPPPRPGPSPSLVPPTKKELPPKRVSPQPPTVHRRSSRLWNILGVALLIVTLLVLWDGRRNVDRAGNTNGAATTAAVAIAATEAVMAGATADLPAASSLAPLASSTSTLRPTRLPSSTPIPSPSPTPLPSSTPIPSPSPTSLPTATSFPLPSSTAPQSAPQPQGVVVPVSGAPGDLEGNLYVNPAFLVSVEGDGTLVMRDELSLELFVYDPAVGSFDGDGIDRVEFTIDCPNGEHFEHTESTPRYCAFGGGEPNCQSVQLQSGANIPDSSCTIENDYYYVNITAYPSSQDREPGNWNFYIRPDLPQN